MIVSKTVDERLLWGRTMCRLATKHSGRLSAERVMGR